MGEKVLQDNINTKQTEGFLEIHQKTKSSEYKVIHKQKNLITKKFFENILNFLKTGEGFPITNFAVGDGEESVNSETLVVPGEYGRFGIAVQTIEESLGSFWLINELNLSFGEGNGIIRNIALLMHSPETTLVNYDPLNPDKTGADWMISNILKLSVPKEKTADLDLKFIWKVRLN